MGPLGGASSRHLGYMVRTWAPVPAPAALASARLMSLACAQEFASQKATEVKAWLTGGSALSPAAPLCSARLLTLLACRQTTSLQ